MASKCSRIFTRASVSTIKSAISKPNPASFTRSAAASFAKPAAASKFSPSPLRRFSLSRSPAELGSMASMLPLHSAVATARMTSCLSSSSRCCRALSQGTLCCTSPDL
ncbi:hypothetical protein Salat_1872600 [Sesamum alatum]|uniref:Protein NUCLEAR FUSION DEFECTIVE 6, chloroplastic/mitochondrial-like n=1 Tax=Sesamum alatum TaxID=300844 RepID=A0AAE2CI16_9LAMI|nr:hypothetical protein Salat_1872600 [Sesamum alatum]